MRTERRTAGAAEPSAAQEDHVATPEASPKPPREPDVRRTLGSLQLVRQRPPTPLFKGRMPPPAAARRTDRDKIYGAIHDALQEPGLLPEPRRQSPLPDAAPVQAALFPKPKLARPVAQRTQSKRPKPSAATKLDGGPQPSPAIRFEAYRRLDALEAEHDKNLRHLGVALGSAEARLEHCRALRAEDAKRGVLREGIGDAVWAAERDITQIHSARRDLQAKFGAAKHELDCITGTAKGAAFKQGSPADDNKAFQSYEQRLAQYNRSVEALKSSGALAAVLAVTYALDVELAQGRAMTDRDRAAMDHIHTTGQMLNPAAGLQVSSTGAASPAPGVDHRGAGLTQSQAEIWQARVPRDASSR